MPEPSKGYLATLFTPTLSESPKRHHYSRFLASAILFVAKLVDDLVGIVFDV